MYWHQPNRPRGKRATSGSAVGKTELDVGVKEPVVKKQTLCYCKLNVHFTSLRFCVMKQNKSCKDEAEKHQQNKMF